MVVSRVACLNYFGVSSIFLNFHSLSLHALSLLNDWMAAADFRVAMSDSFPSRISDQHISPLAGRLYWGIIVVIDENRRFGYANSRFRFKNHDFDLSHKNLHSTVSNKLNNKLPYEENVGASWFSFCSCRWCFDCHHMRAVKWVFLCLLLIIRLYLFVCIYWRRWQHKFVVMSWSMTSAGIHTWVVHIRRHAAWSAQAVIIPSSCGIPCLAFCAAPTVLTITW